MTLGQLHKNSADQPYYLESCKDSYPTHNGNQPQDVDQPGDGGRDSRTPGIRVIDHEHRKANNASYGSFSNSLQKTLIAKCYLTDA